jgi:predicted alpha/beta superfamily hydrolase
METFATKTDNVVVIDEQFYIPQLHRTRRIWLYLPNDYYQGHKRYPVIYMQDGQNLFDQATAFGDEWAVDKTLNALLADSIIVGIDNCEHRLTEYNFNDHPEYGSGEGKRYIEFITETLKPFIDANYRTKPERVHTVVAGSSMGGLISLYGAIHFPHVFGSAGVFSPSLWLVADQITELLNTASQNKLSQRVYFYGGAKEGSNMITHVKHAANHLKGLNNYTIHLTVDPEGEHSEYHWRKVFPEFYKWLAVGW